MRTWWRACSGTRAAHHRCTRATSSSGRAIASLAIWRLGCGVERVVCGVESLLAAPIGLADDFPEVAVLRRDGSVAGDAAIVLQWLTDDPIELSSDELFTMGIEPITDALLVGLFVEVAVNGRSGRFDRLFYAAERTSRPAGISVSSLPEERLHNDMPTIVESSQL